MNSKPKPSKPKSPSPPPAPTSKSKDDYAIEFLIFEHKTFSGKIMNYDYAKAMLETFKKEKGL